MTTRTVTDTQIISVGLGKAGEIQVNLHQLTDATFEWVFMYGLRQVLNDAHASEKEPEAKRALTQKRLEKLYSGEMSKRAGGGRTVDPVAKEAKRLAAAAIKAWGEAACQAKMTKLGLDEAAFTAKVVEHFRPQAEKNVAALAEIEIDL